MNRRSLIKGVLLAAIVPLSVIESALSPASANFGVDLAAKGRFHVVLYEHAQEKIDGYSNICRTHHLSTFLRSAGSWEEIPARLVKSTERIGEILVIEAYEPNEGGLPFSRDGATVAMMPTRYVRWSDVRMTIRRREDPRKIRGMS